MKGLKIIRIFEVHSTNRFGGKVFSRMSPETSVESETLTLFVLGRVNNVAVAAK